MKTKLNLLLVGGILLAAVLKVAGQPAINFTRVTTGPIATNGSYPFGCGWGDYDGDGYLDLIVGNGDAGGGLADANALYHNSGDGTFTRVTTGAIATTLGDTTGVTWGDYDNDGDLDLFTSNWARPSFLFRNNGNGSFTRVINGTMGSNSADSNGCAWGDYDHDGFLDLIVANSNGQNEYLYHNNGDGTFTRVLTGPLVTSDTTSGAPRWTDYDGNGWLDLFITSVGTGTNLLFRNNGGGAFQRVNSAPTGTNSAGHSDWGDFDNDGDLDLFVAQKSPANQLLYRNDGQGVFTRITAGSIVTSTGNSTGCAWGDFDNDGWLDLFVANTAGQNDFLFRNNGNGTFTRVTQGSIVNDGASSLGCAAADYDNDGFLDLYSYWDGGLYSQGFPRTPGLLYHNDGNTNRWLIVRCVGAASNRSGIGAKVRAEAVLGGATLRQTREITGGSGFDGAGLRAHFGLGDATNVSLLRIEWPSGTVQELRNVAANQILTVTEPPRLESAVRLANGSFQFQLTGGLGFRYSVETSSNLTAWTPWMTVTNTNRTMLISDPAATNAASRFYRAVMQ